MNVVLKMYLDYDIIEIEAENNEKITKIKLRYTAG